MAKGDKDTFDQTEKALKLLIEKAQNENSALSKILNVLNLETKHADDIESSGETKAKPIDK